MTTAEESLKNSFIYYGILLCFEGLLFFLFPNTGVGWLQLAPLDTEQTEQYARFGGLAVFIIGCHYILAGLDMSMSFFKSSILARPLVLPTIAAFIFFGIFEWPFIFLGIQDFLAAYWSYNCLKAYEREENDRYRYE